ncbi:IS481 family transposase [Propionibacterium australiense]|uniref:IS481 family transposase n=1 Tax=Propionibacterium australiense TaxID=119981 RepID=UPI00217D7489|nr:IS481 family transposase [Propionibacterium australiense]
MSTHANAPLTVEGRHRLVERCRHRPIAHVAAEMGVSRVTASKWVNRYRQEGEEGLADRSSRPACCPSPTPPEVIEEIERLRRERKWSARLIWIELTDTGVEISQATVGRWLRRLGLNRRRWLDVDGELLRKPGKITARYKGHMVHLDVKKVGRIPDGGGWRSRGRGKAGPRQKVGYTYLHSAIDGFSRLAYTEPHTDEKAATVLEFWRNAQAFFAAHGITEITRVITDNGPCYTSELFTARLKTQGITHQRTRPYTPRHNGKVERYNRILAEELLYAHPYHSETERAQAVTIWNIHYNYHRPHTACRDQPPATRLPTGVTNVMRNYT